MAQSTPWMLNPWPASGGVKIWGATATTVGGVATFNPTVDGTPSGDAIFTGASPAVSLCAENNTSTFTQVPSASVKAFAGDRKSLTVNVYVGTVLGILGATTLPAPDGTVVHAHIIGM